MTRGEAIEILTKSIKWFKPYTSIAEEWEEAMSMAIEALKQEPVKHGKWIEGELYIKCSECGYPAGHLSDNYCPNCGADMRGETE